MQCSFAVIPGKIDEGRVALQSVSKHDMFVYHPPLVLSVRKFMKLTESSWQIVIFAIEVRLCAAVKGKEWSNKTGRKLDHVTISHILLLPVRHDS